MSLSDLVFVDPHLAVPERFARVSATQPTPWPQAGGDSSAWPVSVAADGRWVELTDYLNLVDATSLLGVQAGTVQGEWYAEGCSASSLFLGASMTKSALAHLVGLAVDAGALGMNDRVGQYLPELPVYADVTVDSLLTMTSGVDWVEDHFDPGSLASGLVSAFATGGDSRAVLSEVRAGVAPGLRYRYNTADSQVLDWVRERATGLTFPAALSKVWAGLGAEHDAAVFVDGHGVAMAGGGLAACTRDWARLANLQLTGGHGDLRLSAQWLSESATPPEEFLKPGRLPSSITTHAGFARHWWPLDEQGRTLMADGSRGQFSYLNTNVGMLVVQTSQWPYRNFLQDRTNRDLCYLMLPEIVRQLTEEEEP